MSLVAEFLDADDKVIGKVALREGRAVVVSGGRFMRELLEQARVWQSLERDMPPETPEDHEKLVKPEDGERYMRLLPKKFNSPYLRVRLVER